MSIAALRELRRIFPDSHISLHTRDWAEGLFRDADFIDDLVTFEKNRWKIKDVYDNSQFLRNDGYELAILFPNSFESAVTTFFSRIPRRIGYNKDVRGLLLTDPIAVPEWKDRKHEVFYYLNLIAEVERRMLGRDTVSQAIPNTDLNISDERKTEARRKLSEFGVDLNKKIVALGVGSTNSRAKRWPAERYANLNDKLQNDLDGNVILIGVESEKDVSGTVMQLSNRQPIDLTGKTDLAEAVALLSVIDLLISNDMGLAHVAPAVGTSTIAIFGPTNDETTRPYSSNAEVIRKDVDCAPCMLRDCPIDHRCMTRISVDEVFEAAQRRLADEREEYEEATCSIS